MNQFPPEFRDQLNNLMRWRRDVRHFHADKPVSDELLAQVLDIRLETNRNAGKTPTPKIEEETVEKPVKKTP